MGIRKWHHRGREKLVLSKIWQDGTRFRRFMPNRTVAKQLETRIDYTIAMGTWPKLREELAKGSDANGTYLSNGNYIRTSRTSAPPVPGLVN